MGRVFKFDLKQGIGAPSTAVVKAGDKVKRGQVLGEADLEKLSVPVHASVNGVVTEVTDTHVSVEKTDDNQEYEKIDQSGSTSDIVRRAGIIGMGGAGFPTYVKLNTKLNPDGFILVNAAECEPVLDHNVTQINEELEHLIKGIHIAMKATGAEHGIIGIKLKHRDTIKKITSYLKENSIKDIKVVPLRNIYPVGEERALIRDTINILLSPGALPAEANAVVLNVETVCAIYDAVENGKPLIDKYVTVAGRVNNLEEGKVKVFKTPTGVLIDDIIEDFGGFKGEVGEVVLGGPYTGLRAGKGACVDKNTGGILITQPFDKVKDKLGIIQCACGPKKERLLQIAKSMGAEVVGHRVCKNAVEGNGGAYKCKDPGNCPGQAEHVLFLKKANAGEVLIGHCTDCTNTVMGSAPKMGMEVHHVTDHVLKTMNMPVIREYNEGQL